MYATRVRLMTNQDAVTGSEEQSVNLKCNEIVGVRIALSAKIYFNKYLVVYTIAKLKLYFVTSVS